jgi:sulfur carrier protein
MIIRMNGVEKDIDGNTTVAALLKELDIKAAGIAVEINREIVPRRLHAETIVNAGDSIEIVRMTSGG